VSRNPKAAVKIIAKISTRMTTPATARRPPRFRNRFTPKYHPFTVSVVEKTLP
jgi:hypothetical protein